MNEIKLEYNENEVKWLNNNRKIKIKLKEVEYASIVEDMIYVETFDENYECWYFNMDGELLLSFSTDLGQIKVPLSSEEIYTVKIDKLQSVAFDKHMRIYALMGEGENSKMCIYSNKGNKITEILPPKNYTFYRFCDVGKDVSVICQGNELTKDSYGRNDWKFAYNLETGLWTRISLAY